MQKKEDFYVRPCRYDELPEVISINESTLPENYPLYFYEQILERYPECFLVTELINTPGKLIGYVMWRIERGISSFGIQLIRKGHLVSIAVTKEYQRNGAATQMLKKSMEKVIDYDISEFVLEVRISNNSAINLYQNVFNFKKIRILEKYYRDGENAYYFALKREDYPFV